MPIAKSTKAAQRKIKAMPPPVRAVSRGVARFSSEGGRKFFQELSRAGGNIQVILALLTGCRLRDEPGPPARPKTGQSRRG